MARRTVLISAAELIPELKARTSLEGELLVFPDSEPLRALEAILKQRPGLVLLERVFAATPRGAALINRLKADPVLRSAEIRVLSHDSDYSRVVSTRPAETQPPATEAPEPLPQLDHRGTRRAPRFNIREGVEAQIGGEPATLVNLSRIGAQVLLSTALKPFQRVRMLIGSEKDALRFSASVAWSKFELPRGGGTAQYRAGMEFIQADADAVEEFCERNRVE